MCPNVCPLNAGFPHSGPVIRILYELSYCKLWKKSVVHGTFALCADVVRARLRRVVRRVVRSLVRGPCAQLCACVERLCAKPCAQELCANHPRRGRVHNSKQLCASHCASIGKLVRNLFSSGTTNFSCASFVSKRRQISPPFLICRLNRPPCRGAFGVPRCK